MAYTYQQQLDSVQLAIANIEAGNQSYTIGNRSYTKADLATLYTREKYLMSRIEREANGGIIVKSILP